MSGTNCYLCLESLLAICVQHHKLIHLVGGAASLSLGSRGPLLVHAKVLRYLYQGLLADA